MFTWKSIISGNQKAINGLFTFSLNGDLNNFTITDIEIAGHIFMNFTKQIYYSRVREYLLQFSEFDCDKTTHRRTRNHQRAHHHHHRNRK